MAQSTSESEIYGVFRKFRLVHTELVWSTGGGDELKIEEQVISKGFCNKE
jgi:hypothetical protein